jgi:hypothetical protein
MTWLAHFGEVAEPMLLLMNNLLRLFAAHQITATRHGGASEEVAEPPQERLLPDGVYIEAAGAQMERALRCDGWL